MNNIRLSKESWAMRVAIFFGMKKIAWSLRRLHCPVNSEALVLEIGAGGNPYFRSNVLVDAYESTGERHWVPLETDRPIVLAFAEKLPFNDKQFDFVIASHVLEHSLDPVKFLSEIQRVARAGYIEVPDAFMERINPYPDHRLEITVRNSKLMIKKKATWKVDAELVELYEDRAKRIVANGLIPSNPFDFHVRYYWSERIEYEIINPQTSIPFGAAEEPNTRYLKSPSFRAKVQAVLLKLTRKLLSQHSRNRKINLISLLRCTQCLHDELHQTADILACHNCGAKYKINCGIPDMTKEGLST
jgi:SAM-dependent methyltransferase